MGTASPAALSDGELARRISNSGDAAREAVGELYRRFWPRVRSFGLRHLGNDEAARDLAQHVLLLTVDKLRNGEVRAPERVSSFILSTARWALHSQRREALRFESIDGETERAVELRNSDLPGWTAPQPLVERASIRGCLESLAERNRTVVVLSFFQGCTAQEIADTTGLTAGNVRVVRHRALGLLRHCLGAGIPAEASTQREHGE